MPKGNFYTVFKSYGYLLSASLLLKAGVQAEDYFQGASTGRTLLGNTHNEHRGEKAFVRITENAFKKITKLVAELEPNQRNFFTKENVNINSTHYTGKWWQYTKASEEERMCRKERCTMFVKSLWEALPSIEPKSWGRCATVAYGNNLLRNHRGAEIDLHDTVVRLGMVPLTPYKNIAGEKSTYVWIRDRKLRRFGHTFINEDMYGFRASDLEPHQLPKGLIYNNFRPNMTGGWSVISFGGDLNRNVELLAGSLLKIAVQHKTAPDPTSGLLLPLTLLFSSYCTSVSVFGVSADMGGRYWDGKSWDPHTKILQNKKRKKGVKYMLASNHNTRIESELLKVLEVITETTNIPSLKFFP